MRVARRHRGICRILRIAAVSALWFGAAAACGGTTGGGGDDGGNGGVDVDLEVPRGDDYIFELSEAVETSASGQGSSRRVRNGRTSLEFTGVAVDSENFSLRFNVEAVEGETGTFESAQTAQLTHGSSTYKTETLGVKIETHGGGQIAGAVEGAFEQKVSGGETTELSPPVRMEGRFDFPYE